jgi:PAS domain S-box-containing protein
MFEENKKNNLTNTVDSNFTNQSKMEKELADNLKPKVLIVDDEENFAVTLKDILDLKGYEADIANNGKQALQLISEPHSEGNGQYDISLVDLNLPDTQGLELIQCFKLYSPDTEVIIITGNPSLPTAIKAMNAGAFGYIEKPYNIDRLFILLERAIERHRLIKVLKESETRYRRLFEELGAAILLLNLKTLEISHPNKAFTILFGYSEAELPQLGFKDFFLPEEFPKLGEGLEKLKTEGTASFETQLRRKGNRPFWAELYLTLIGRTALEKNYASNKPSTAESDPIALILVMDLTKWKNAENDLLKTKSYLETIFNGISSGVAIIDLNYTVLDANPAYCKLMGISLKDVIGKKCYELHHGHKMPCANLGEICPIQSCRASGVSSRVYHEHQVPVESTLSGEAPIQEALRSTASGSYLEITVAPLKDISGNLNSFISVLNDLTEIRKAHKDLETKSHEFELLNQELLKQKEKLLDTANELEKANTELIEMSEAKSEFVSAVSHELRIPLTAIMQGVGLVEDGSLGSINTDQQRFLVLAKNNVKRLADLINDLLDLSKIEARRFDIIPIKLDLERTIRELAQTLESLVKEKGLTLKIELPDGLSPVFADERSIFRILMNLLSNAIKFTPAGGTITISTNLRDGTTLSLGNQVVVSVTDTGVGIPKDQQYKLFGKFQQISRQGSPRTPGTGLGLALSKELVELNHGEIWVESEEGKGSKFSFSLPVYEEYEDLKQTIEAMLKDCRQASVPFVIFLFKILPGLQAISQQHLSEVLDTIENLVKSHTNRVDIVRRISDQGSLFVLSLTNEANVKAIYNQILDSLRSTTFPVENQEIGVKLVSCYHLINQMDNFTIDQLLLICNTKLEEIR